MGHSVSVLGASGYVGGELVRLLAGHPALSVARLGGRSSQMGEVAAIHPHLLGLDMGRLASLEETAATPADVCFSCLPSGALQDLIPLVAAPVVIDLSGDHRAAPGWLYGLVEMVRNDIPRSGQIANPGCYPTAVLLALVPFARAGVISGPITVDALSGTSGAGQDVDKAYLFSALHGSAAAYGDTEHRHIPEMERGLKSLGGLDCTVSFTPHLVPMARGLLATCRVPVMDGVTDADVLTVLSEAYADEPFVTVVDAWPATKAVAGTNRALVTARVDVRNGLLISSSAIDNLGKGAAGQALQNANVVLGLDERAGLEQVAAWP
jgi:N-acetyl-gamma-glutamyl-phosphate reductase